MDNLLGTTIGNYQVVEKLGRGGMANVYKAYHPGLAVHRALKVIRPDMVHEQGFSQRFQLEARAIAGLRHPHIVQVHDFGHQGDLFYMVLELVAGENLRDRIRRVGPIRPFAEAVRIVEQLASALGYAHSHGILHRDVKPENILLSADGQAILADFGIAKMLEPSDAKLTATGIGIGTPAYMAPELARGSTELSPASDLYAAGVVLYETLTARAPFAADTPLAVLQRVIHDPVPPPRDLSADIPDVLQGVVLKAMAKDPALRYPSADAFIEACRQSLLGLGPQAGGVPPLPLAAAGAAYDSRPTIAVATEVPAGSGRSRRPLIAGVLAFLLLLALAGAAFFAFSRYRSTAGDRDAAAATSTRPSSDPLAADSPPDAAEPDRLAEALPPPVATDPLRRPQDDPDSAAGPREESRPQGGVGLQDRAVPQDRAERQDRAGPQDRAPQDRAGLQDGAGPRSSAGPRQRAGPRDAAGLQGSEEVVSGEAAVADPIIDHEPAPTGPAILAFLELDSPVVGEVEAGDVAHYAIELRRPVRLVFDIVTANRRGIYTLTDPAGREVFQQLGNDYGPFAIEDAGLYQLTVETESDIPLVFELQFRRVGW